MISVEQVLERLRSELNQLAEVALGRSEISESSLLVSAGKWQGVRHAIEVIQGMVNDERRKSKELEKDPEFT